MRKIFFDTETTGLSPEDGDRVIQIGLVEMIDKKITNQKEYFLNPEGKKSIRGAFEVHGIKDSFLIDKPKFSEIAEQFLEWIKGAELYAHNASFDIEMINNELRLSGKPERIDQICKVVDTIDLVRKKLPITRYKLDVVMKYLKIDYQQKRNYHSALEDSIILAKVYLALHKNEKNLFSAWDNANDDNDDNGDNDSGANISDKANLSNEAEGSNQLRGKKGTNQNLNTQMIDILLSTATNQEQLAHQNFFQTAKEKTIRKNSI